MVEGWLKASALLDQCDLKRTFARIALKVVRNGCYYGYRIEQKGASYIQELPINYCRSRFKLNNDHIVEFNVKYFDDNFKDIEYRIRVLKMFPKEFQQAYIKYKHGTLKQDTPNEEKG